MNKNGAVFVITLVILSIAVMVCAGLATLMSRDVYTARRLRMSTQAYFLAEAGIEKSIRDLYDNNFSFAGFPKNETLGNGSFAVSTPQEYADNIYKIESTGTVSDVSRKISVVVEDTREPWTRYAALSDGTMTIMPGTEIWGDVYSNQSGARVIINWGVVHGTLCTRSTHSNAIVNHGTADGSRTGVTDVDMPVFDENFWGYYYNLAPPPGYTGTQFFTSNPNPANGVIWVNSGQARLIGTWAFTGCLITRTGPIRINFIADGTITQNQYQNQDGAFPAFMSGSYLEIWDPTTINGLVYAGGWIWIASFVGERGVEITGQLISGNWMWIGDNAQLHYAYSTPPGLTAPAPLEVVCWGS